MSARVWRSWEEAAMDSVDRALVRVRSAGPGEGHDGECESEFYEGPMAWSPCRCDERSGAYVDDPEATP